MIEILLKNKEIIKVNSTAEIKPEQMDFYAIQFIDFTEEHISWVGQNFGINCSLMRRYDDIEISSHFLVKDNQAAFHISIPYYDLNNEKKLVEAPIFFVMSNSGLFFFSNAAINQFFDAKYAFRFSDLHEVSNIRDILMYQLEFISDYYADITENEARQIKNLVASVTLNNEFSKDITDLITLLNFNNLRLKESLIETIRVFGVFKKTASRKTAIPKKGSKPN